MHKTAGVGGVGLLGMKRVGVEVTGAGTDRGIAYFALRRLGMVLRSLEGDDTRGDADENIR